MITKSKKKIVKRKTKAYNEIFQSIDLKFSFVTEKDGVYTELFSPVKCRDFLGDCIYSKHKKEEVCIYGFSFLFEETPFDEDKIKLSLTFPNTEAMENFKKNFFTQSLLEKQYKIAPSVWYETDHKETLVVEASKIWQSAIWKISLFTFYLKLLCYQTREQAKDPENEYLKALTPEKEEKLMKNIRKEKEIYNHNIIRVHHDSGFYTILRGIHNKEMTNLLGVQ